MFDYLDKFNSLDQKIREKVSNPFVIGVIEQLEKEYEVDLASVVMMVMIKAVPIADLAIHLSDQFSLSEEKAKALAQDMKEKVFLGVADYLGLDLSQLFVNKIEEVKLEEPKAEEIKVEEASAPKANPYNQEIDAVIRATIIEMNLNLALDLAERLTSALNLYWRDVRNKIDTRALLAKTVETGGFALSDQIIDALLNVLDKKKGTANGKKQAEIKKPNSGVLEKIGQLAKDSARYESDYNLASILDTKHEISGGLDLSHEIAPVKPVAPVLPKAEIKPDLSAVIEKEPAKPVVPPVVPAPIVAPTITPVVAPVPAPIVKPQPAVSASPVKPVENKPVKPKVEDIKPVRIMNPIDELRYMDLVNFRRMSKDADDITKKIKSRIKLLEGEDYEKGLAGTTAWRQSPVNKLYLKIINSSLSEGKTIPEIIDGLKSKNQDYLTLAEVEAIISLNSELKF